MKRIEKWLSQRIMHRASDGGKLLLAAINETDNGLPRLLVEAITDWVENHASWVDMLCIRVACREAARRRDVGKITIQISQGWKEPENKGGGLHMKVPAIPTSVAIQAAQEEINRAYEQAHKDYYDMRNRFYG